MEQTETRPLAPRLVEVLARGRAATYEVMGRLSSTEVSANGSGGDWTFKDMLSHISGWQQVTVGRLAAAAAGTTPLAVADETEYNEARLAASRALSWDRVLDDYENVQKTLTAAVIASRADDLTDTTRFSWTNGGALWRPVLGNGYLHPIEHLAGILVAYGQLDAAEAVQKGAIATLRELLGDTNVANDGVYNLACFYAKTGQREQALTTLREALTLAPNLKEWSREDADLVSLHGDPEFVAIIADS